MAKLTIYDTVVIALLTLIEAAFLYTQYYEGLIAGTIVTLMTLVTVGMLHQVAETPNVQHWLTTLGIAKGISLLLDVGALLLNGTKNGPSKTDGNNAADSSQ